MAAQNRLQVLELLLRNECESQRQIAQMAGLRASTVSNIVRSLKKIGIIRESGVLEASRAGPKEVALEIDPSCCYAAAVSLDLRGFELCLANAEGHVITREALPNKTPFAKLTKILPERIAALAETWKLSARRFAGLTVSVQGIVDPPNGRVLFSRSLGMENVNVRDPLQKALSAPVYVERNIQCGAYFEQYRGVARRHPTFIYYLLRRLGSLPLEQGIGMVIERNNFRGANSSAGELDLLFSPDENGTKGRISDLYSALGRNLASVINLTDISSVVISSDDPLLTEEHFKLLQDEVLTHVLPVPGRRIEILRSPAAIEGLLQGALLMSVHRHLQKEVRNNGS